MGGRSLAESVDDDFGLAEHSDGKERRANAARGVAVHGFMLPGASFIGTFTAAMREDRFSAWQANLPSM